MSSASVWPVPITTIGSAEGATVVFRHGGKLHVSCILKASFSLQASGPMKLLVPEPISRGDSFVRTTSDVVPYLPRVDILLTGHAYAPAGSTVTMQKVRLALFRENALLDKTLHVYGNRDGTSVKPFEKLPIVYERALGGIGFRPNPLGTGKSPGTSPPNVVYPDNGSLVASFAPIPLAFAQRKALLGSMPPSNLELPIADLPADFDWAYFQAAPRDQQLESLVGNEWVVLEGLHPTYPTLSSRLPSARGLAMLFGFDPNEPEAARAMSLKPDMLRIDADALTCSLLFRAVVPLPNEAILRTLRIVGGVEVEGRPIARLLKLASPPPLPEPSQPERPAPHAESNERTVAWARGGADHPFAGTTAIEPKRVQAPVTPFNKALARAEDQGSDESTRQMARRTLVMDEATQETVEPVAGPLSPATPFLAPMQAAPAVPAQPIPGAPWSGVVAAAPPSTERGEMTRMLRVNMQSDSETDSQILGPLMIPPPAPPPVPARVAKEEPEEVEVDLGDLEPSVVAEIEKPAPVMVQPVQQEAPKREPKPSGQDVWSNAPVVPMVEAPKPPPARIPAKPPVNKSLYGSFAPSTKKK